MLGQLDLYLNAANTPHTHLQHVKAQYETRNSQQSSSSSLSQGTRHSRAELCYIGYDILVEGIPRYIGYDILVEGYVI